LNHNNTPDMGMPIYMNSCSCKHLWDEVDPQGRQRNGDHGDHANCDFDNWPLAMAYVPMQPWEIPFDPAESLKSGTIFPSLFLPFKGGARK